MQEQKGNKKNHEDGSNLARLQDASSGKNWFYTSHI